jgi:DNA-binding PadR family transcriptional regulator
LADRSDPPVSLTPAMFALLLALHAGDRHGYALMDDVAQLTGQTIRLGPGTLYRSLQRLRMEDLVEEIHTDPGPATRADRRAERRRSYRLTPAGRAAAAAEAHRLALLVDAATAAGLLTDRTGD